MNQLLLVSLFLVACLPQKPLFAVNPSDELREATLVAMAEWNAASTDVEFYLSDEGWDVSYVDGYIDSTNNPESIGGTFQDPRSIIISRNLGLEAEFMGLSEEMTLHTLLMSEFCHMLSGNGGHPAGEGVCGERQWFSRGVVSEADLEWLGLSGSVDERLAP